MKNIQAMAGGSVGYVRGVFSERCRGVAIPAELLRAHLRGVARVGVRRRLAAEFAGYLVTEEEAGYPFRNARERYLRMFAGWTMGRTGFSAGDDGGGDLDAPGWVPAGSVRACFGRLAERRAYPVYLSRELLAARGGE